MTDFIKNYLDLSKKYQDEFGSRTLVLMQCGDFFEVYATLPLSKCIVPMEEYSQLTDLAIATKYVRGATEQTHVMAGFKLPYLDRYLKILIANGYTVPVFTQDPYDVKNRSCEIFSEGRSLDVEVGEVGEVSFSNFLACIWVEEQRLPRSKTVQYEVGFSAVDILSGVVVWNEFILPELSALYLDALEGCLRVYSPRETCLILTGITSVCAELEAKRAEIITAIGLVGKIHGNISETKIANCKKQTYQQSSLARYYPKRDTRTSHAEFYQHPCATQSLCYLLDFVFYGSQPIVELKEPVWEKSRNSLYLGNHSLKQLEIKATENGKGLFSMMNQCKSPMGRREFQDQFFHPITDPIKLEREYQLIEDTMSLMNLSQAGWVWTSFRDLPDLAKMFRKMQSGKLPLEKIQGWYHAIQTAQNIFQSLAESALGIAMNITPLQLVEWQANIDLLKTYFIFPGEAEGGRFPNEAEGGRVGVECIPTPEIKALKEEKEANLHALNEFIKGLEALYPVSVKNKTGSIKLHQTEKNIVLRVTNTRAKILEDECAKSKHTDFQGITFEKDTKTEKCICSSQIKKWQTAILESQENWEEFMYVHYQQILRKLTEPQLVIRVKQMIETLGKLDVAFCKAHLSKKYKYCRPTFHPELETGFQAVGLRHPLIEIQPNLTELYVANDLSMTSSESGLLLYGTNAVGKTSFIKSVGLAIYLAQIGMYVPASSFQYTPYHAIYTRILGQDNLYQGLSTFAVEMLELKNILIHADQHTLVIGDELCSGTETTSAISIFTAGITTLIEKGATFLFSTHLHEIITLPEILELIPRVRMKHLSVIYDKSQDKLIYYRTLQDGAGSPMYGLEFCYSLGFPPNFLNQVNQLRSKYYSTSVLEQVPSKYNKDKLKGGVCEKCGILLATEIHHLQPQHSDPLYKNHPANLLNVCNYCHQTVFHPISTHETTTHTKRKTVGM